MDLWKMRYFVQICNDKSITKAAKNLYISQQGLSKAIKSIEDEFQICLLERSSKGVRPTPHGEILLDKCKMIISEYDEMVETLNQKVKQDNQSICIGIPSILYTDLLKSLLLTFQENNPEVRLKFVELGSFACERNLKDNLVDLCITLRPNCLDTYRYIPICETGLVLLFNKKNSLSKKKRIRLKDLKSESFIMLTEEYKIHKITTDYCARSGFKPKVAITSSQLHFIKELISLNKGIAILPDIGYVKDKRDNNIMVSPIEDLTYKVEIGIIIDKTKKANKIISKLIKTVDDFVTDFVNSKIDNYVNKMHVNLKGMLFKEWQGNRYGTAPEHFV